MNTYRDQTFNQRFSTMGDIAENAYEEWATIAGQTWDRYGLNRPRSAMSQWGPFIRYAPDYIQHNRFVEVKGCGKDGLVKIKQENFAALKEWSTHLPVWLWVWSTKQEDYAFFELDNPFSMWLGEHCTTDRFPDNNKLYWNLPFTACQEEPWLETDAHANV